MRISIDFTGSPVQKLVQTYGKVNGPAVSHVTYIIHNIT